MNYGTIKNCDIANGEGVRVSLFVSGCTQHCKECFNPETWNFGYGEPFTAETERQILDMLAPSYIRGLSLLGGEPFEPDNQRVLVKFLRRVKESYPDKDIWCYTGYTLESDLLPGADSRAYCEVTDEMLSMIDVLVDGEFILEQKNISLRFRGSENQRIIWVKRTLSEGVTILWTSGNDDVNQKMHSVIR
ncbi:MAG: anaerobic ribonucleoside-triphosphate reductase activating protein [Clostridia bacterium]|nr:anaerobic ribonucleoside-triphosphate reductase activating protein [Clostridia bacterium]